MILACMFPGQGAHAAGIDRDLLARHPRACAIADAVLGEPIAEICAQPSRLALTAHAQPAVFFASCLAYLERRRDQAFAPTILLGHGLGLYAAMHAAECFDLETGLAIVAERGRLMGRVTGGAMLEVTGEDARDPHATLVGLEAHDIDVAHHDGPTQVVLSGPADRIASIAPVLEARGNRCVRLDVAGAFHSRRMAPVRQAFTAFLVGQPLRPPTIELHSSTTGERIGSEHLIEELGFQLTRPVRWMQTVLALRDRHPGLRFEEIGPGRALTALDGQIGVPTRSNATASTTGRTS